jgi:hypothetical protein
MLSVIVDMMYMCMHSYKVVILLEGLLWSVLHSWPIDVVAVLQSGSNSWGDLQYSGKLSEKCLFQSLKLYNRKPREIPITAYSTLRNTSSPKYASLASFAARLPILLGDRSFGYLTMTWLADLSFCFFITDEGR